MRGDGLALSSRCGRSEEPSAIARATRMRVLPRQTQILHRRRGRKLVAPDTAGVMFETSVLPTFCGREPEASGGKSCARLLGDEGTRTTIPRAPKSYMESKRNRSLGPSLGMVPASRWKTKDVSRGSTRVSSVGTDRRLSHKKSGITDPIVTLGKPRHIDDRRPGARLAVRHQRPHRPSGSRDGAPRWHRDHPIYSPCRVRRLTDAIRALIILALSIWGPALYKATDVFTSTGLRKRLATSRRSRHSMHEGADRTQCAHQPNRGG
jgi:hypothetical protein